MRPSSRYEHHESVMARPVAKRNLCWPAVRTSGNCADHAFTRRIIGQIPVSRYVRFPIESEQLRRIVGFYGDVKLPGVSRQPETQRFGDRFFPHPTAKESRHPLAVRKGRQLQIFSF